MVEVAERQTIAPTGEALAEAAVEELATRLRGSLLRPGDPGYDDARAVQNGLIDRRPGLIVRCAGTADVVAAVNVARDHGLLLSIRGGGHNVAGTAVNDGGLVVDLSGMRGVRVDPAARTARVQGGATWGEVDRETQRFGLATPGGMVSTTGVGGLTLHGGYGHLRRKHGLSLDNLLSVEIVTADGRVRTASADEHEDLFWAVRGAGSNVGVVTSFEFRLHPIGPTLMRCASVYALEDGRTVLRRWREFTASAPDEVSSVALAWSVPDVDAFPPELRRRPVVILAGVYAGSVAEAERIMRPLREIATPLLDLSGPAPYTALQADFDPFFPKGRLYYWKSTYVDDLSDEAIDTIVGRAADRPSPLSDIFIMHLGGAMGRVGTTDTAYGRRDAPYLAVIDATWAEPEETAPNIAWARAAWADMQRFNSGGLYLNFAGFGEEKEALVRAGYGPNYERLAELKATYDPTNLFRMNQNIRPAAV